MPERPGSPHYSDSRHSLNEKRKHPERGASSRSGSFSKDDASRAAAGKKLKQNVESNYLSDNISQVSLENSSSSSSKASTESGDSSPKSGATLKKRREPSKCPYCTVIMTRSHDLRKHVEKLHQGPQEILCHICDFRATDIVVYLAHENDHLCKCPYCGFVAKNYRGLPRHKTFCHMNPIFQGNTTHPHESTRRRHKAETKNH